MLDALIQFRKALVLGVIMQLAVTQTAFSEVHVLYFIVVCCLPPSKLFHVLIQLCYIIMYNYAQIVFD
jgi:hypothetical protein